MSLNDTASGDRIHIGFFGLRNAGKSSIVNAVTSQEMSVVSEVKGTTTDTVRKSMEILPLGPVVIIDTPGIDDEGSLGEKRIQAARKITMNCDIAVLVTECGRKLQPAEEDLIRIFEQRKIPWLTVCNKTDLCPAEKKEEKENTVYTCALTGQGVEELKEKIGRLLKPDQIKGLLLEDVIRPEDVVVLVTPIDGSAPKGRMILPQQMMIREILDLDAVSVVTKEKQLQKTLELLEKSGQQPALVVTDSQVFAYVRNIVPETIPLTSFSILMARYKGFLTEAVKGARKIDRLQSGAKILISEGCTHHRQCEDIGTVKLPALLRKYTGKDFSLSYSSGREYPEDIQSFDLVIHCGGCMLNAAEMQYRMKQAVQNGVPFTNYGIAIAWMNGILERSIRMLPEMKEITER